MSKKKGKKISKVGRVNIENHNGYYRLRWTFEGVRRSLTVCPTNSLDSEKLTRLKAQEIDNDINLETLEIKDSYDRTLSKYSNRVKTEEKQATSSPESWNLFQIWEDYKQSAKVAHSTSSNWRVIDIALKKISQYLNSKDTDKVVPELLKHYSVNTLDRHLKNLIAATNKWSKQNKIDNPWKDIRSQLPKQKYTSKRTKEVWSNDELNVIREDFECSHYYGYISFLVLTGCRPQEAIALTWDDIDWNSNCISINKVFTYGQLKLSTKTEKDRMFPVNPQLDNLIKSVCFSEHTLLFPTATGKYIDQRNFNNREFKPRIDRLFNEGKISKKLPTYNIRNSWITLMLKKGIDIATVAKLAGTSEKMIINNYWGSDSNVIVPII